jgi:hypothetical protein
MLKPRSVLIVAVLAAVGAWVVMTVSSATPPQDARMSDAAGVHVVVTPKAVDATAKVWEFDVAMDTHIRPLGEDIAAAAVLVDDSGHRSTPVAWQGDPPGGHHRRGVLRFNAPSEESKAFELQLTGVGGADLRTFRWEVQ